MAGGGAAKIGDLALDPYVAQCGIVLYETADVAGELADGVGLGESRAAEKAELLEHSEV
jgi:hypothetical protein